MKKVTVPLYFTGVGAVGYAEYENASSEHNIFMFEPEYLNKVFGSIPPYLTITISAEERQESSAP